MLPIYSSYLCLLMIVYTYAQQIDFCEEYLTCRQLLLRKQWKCLEIAKRSSEGICGTSDVLSNFRQLVEKREAVLGICFSQQQRQDICSSSTISKLSMTTDCSTPEKDHLLCASYQHCCPVANRCSSQIFPMMISMNVRWKQEETTKSLLECSRNINKIIVSDSLSEDSQIADVIVRSNDDVIRITSSIALLIQPDVTSSSKKTTGMSKQRSSNTFVPIQKNSADGTASVLKIQSFGFNSLKSHNHRKHRRKYHRKRADNELIGTDELIERLLLERRTLQPTVSSSGSRRPKIIPFVIRKPWSKSKKVATRRHKKRKVKTIYTHTLVPKKKRRRMGIMRITDNQVVRAKSPQIQWNNNGEVARRIQFPPETFGNPQFATQTDFLQNFVQPSSELVSFSRNVIPLPLPVPDVDPEPIVEASAQSLPIIEDSTQVPLMEAGINSGGTWTMIPMVEETTSSSWNPLENFVDEGLMKAAEVGDIQNFPPTSTSSDSSFEDITAFKNDDMRTTTETMQIVEIPMPTDNFRTDPIISIDGSSQKNKFFSDINWPFRRAQGSKTFEMPEFMDDAKILDTLRNTKEHSTCRLHSLCHELYLNMQTNCSTSKNVWTVPGLPKRRDSKCSEELRPLYQDITISTRVMEENYGLCLRQHLVDQKKSTCSRPTAPLAHFESSKDCNIQVKIVKSHCKKLSRCCLSSKTCRRKMKSSSQYSETRDKRRKLTKKSQECQISNYHEYSRKQWINSMEFN